MVPLLSSSNQVFASPGLKECSSCGALYTKSCDCSKGGFKDKFVRDPKKTSDSSQRPPQDCPKYGSPVDGLYCRHCALLRKKFKEARFTICDFLNTSESSNDDSNVVNAPQEPIVFNQDLGENSSQSPHETFQCQPMNYYEPNPCYDSFGFDNFQPSQSVIDHLNLQQRINDSMIKLYGTFQAWLQQQKDQVVNLDSYSPKPLQCRKIPIFYDDDDDEESSNPLRDIIISELPLCIAITPVLSTKETKDSLIVGDKHIDIIPEKESDEFIKSIVENLVPILSKSEDERECDVPVCDDFTTFSNLLFDVDNDFTSSDNESFFDEDTLKEIYLNPLFDEDIISIKIDPHHFNAESNLIESLLNQDSSIISSSKIDSFLDEFAEILYDNSSPRPSEEIDSKNSNAAIESFSPSPIPVEDSDSLMEEVDLSLTLDDSMPPGIENDDYDSEGDILILEEFLSNDSLSLLKNKSFHFDISSCPLPPTKPLNDDEIEPNLGILTVKVMGDISQHYVLMPKLLPTQPTLTSNQEKSPYLLSHHGLKAFQLFSEILMMIYGGNIPILDALFLHFYPP
nr:hypothetical protein [Tanacetum cinerariifolium]